MTRVLPLVVLGLFVLGACGGEEEPPSVPPTPAPAAAPEPATGPGPVVPPPEDVDPQPAANEVPDLEKEAYHLLRNGDAAGARERFKAVLERDPDSPVAHRHMAAIELAEGNRERASRHLLKALTLPDRTFGRAGDVLDGAVYANFAVDLWLEGRGQDSDETGLLEEALEADPTNPRAAVILSEINFPRGDGAEALQILERAGKSLASSEEGADLLLRLAVRRLAAGSVEGYSGAVRRIPSGTSAHRLAESLGEPKSGGAAFASGWPRSRPGRPVEGIEDAPVRTAAELDPVAAVGKGIALAVDRLVPGRFVPEIRRAVVYGYLPGLDAFVTDDLTLVEPVLIPGDQVRAGLLRPLGKGADAPAGKAGPAIAAALDLMAEGKLGSAWDGVEGYLDHPLATWVRARIAVVKGDGTSAVTLIRGEAGTPPPGPEWSLLYAEALLARGEVGRALRVLDDAEGADFSEHPLTRRIRALTRMKTDDDSETIAALAQLTRDYPGYAAAWEDLAGLHLAAKRYGPGRDVLVGLAKAVPGFEDVPRYKNARRKAAMGIVVQAKTAADLMRLDGTDDAEIRRVAVKAAARMRPGEARQALAHFLSDPDRTVRVLALRMLGLDAWKGSKDAVCARLDDPDEMVRGAAVSAWAQIGRRDAAKDLARMLADDSAYVREIAVNSLRDLVGKRFGYDARAPEEARAAAAAKWVEYVDGME